MQQWPLHLRSALCGLTGRALVFRGGLMMYSSGLHRPGRLLLQEGPKKKGRGVTHSRDKSARVSRAPGGCYHLLSGIGVTEGDPLHSLPPAGNAQKMIRAVGRRRGGAVHGWRAAGWDLARGRPARRESNDRAIIRRCRAVIRVAFGEGLVILGLSAKRHYGWLRFHP